MKRNNLKLSITTLKGKISSQDPTKFKALQDFDSFADQETIYFLKYI